MKAFLQCSAWPGLGNLIFLDFNVGAMKNEGHETPHPFHSGLYLKRRERVILMGTWGPSI